VSKTPPGVKRSKLEAVTLPELATLVDAAPEGGDWIHEIKVDGYRVLARLEHGVVTLSTRNGNDWTERMPGVARAVAELPAETALIDGEVVVLDPHGVSDFQLLQNSFELGDDAGQLYYAFDLLYLNGEDWRGAACVDRKRRLFELLAKLPRTAKRTLRASEHVHGQGPEFFGGACRLGVEGIVSKRASAPYRAGRGRDWLKVKCTQRQEFVIVGYTDPGGSRNHLGALLLGVHRHGALEYAGKVGTGFNQRSLTELARKLAPLEAREAPCARAPHGARARQVHWVRPELVAEVAFTGFTQDGLLRHPAFRGLREDKRAVEVRPETPRRSAGRAQPSVGGRRTTKRPLESARGDR
jgi:bifunctional non-homologous end joining protein LigD